MPASSTSSDTSDSDPVPSSSHLHDQDNSEPPSLSGDVTPTLQGLGHATTDNIDSTSLHVQEDAMHRIKNMFRLLELHGEQSSGGFVEKVLISQDYVCELIETLSPGASASMTNVRHLSHPEDGCVLMFSAVLRIAPLFTCRSTSRSSINCYCNPLVSTGASPALSSTWSA